MRIKEVSEKTGLTEKAIRLYIENGLIHPYVESGMYRNSYMFSETDVRELEEISVFRKAGFSIFEISLIKEMPEKLPELLDKKRLSLEMEINEKKSIKEAISRLEVHELGSASQIVGLISAIMTIRYMTCTKRAGKLPNRGKGTVISVIEEHGFDASFSGAGGASAGSKEPGIGGIWQIFFMLWNEIRPDCWFPVILYDADEKKKESATLPYGSFKRTWQVGDVIDIAWKEPVSEIVYPLNNKWISKKILFYSLVSLVAFALFIIFIIL